MRYTEKELALFGSRSTADLEGRLNYRPPSGNFRESVFKERWFKLKANFLFYFRINELGVIERKEPAGVFVLEDSQVQAEIAPGISFAFSLVFRDDPDRKHIFSTRSEDQVQQWVSAIQSCSYEHWRTELRKMQRKIKRLTGQDPLLMYPHNESVASKDLTPLLSSLSLSPIRPTRSPNRNKASSFKSHLSSEHSNSAPSLHESSDLFASSFQSHLFNSQQQPTSSLTTLAANNNQLLSQPHTALRANVPVALPSPPRPNRSGSRKIGANSAVVTRTAPPPPSRPPPPVSQLTSTDEQNLIEF